MRSRRAPVPPNPVYKTPRSRRFIIIIFPRWHGSPSRFRLSRNFVFAFESITGRSNTACNRFGFRQSACVGFIFVFQVIISIVVVRGWGGGEGMAKKNRNIYLLEDVLVNPTHAYHLYSKQDLTFRLVDPNKILYIFVFHNIRKQ